MGVSKDDKKKQFAYDSDGNLILVHQTRLTYAIHYVNTIVHVAVCGRCSLRKFTDYQTQTLHQRLCASRRSGEFALLQQCLMVSRVAWVVEFIYVHCVNIGGNETSRMIFCSVGTE